MIRIRTSYSFRHATGSLEKAVAKVKKLKWPAAALTDYCSPYGWIKWDKLCRENGIKPVFGVELPVSPDPTAKKPIWDGWVFLAIDSLLPLNQLIELATSQFRYRPLLSYEQALNAIGVVKVIGRWSNLDKIHKTPELYFALTPGINPNYAHQLTLKEIPPVAASDNRYLESCDAHLFEVGAKDGIVQSWPQWLMSESDWDYELRHLPEAIRQIALHNTRVVLVNKCRAEIPQSELIRPEPTSSLRQKCEDAAEKCGVDLTNPEYKRRLDKELKLISDKNFDDYFHIVADIVEWARARMLVGPARGSAAGSLVCYLLGITTIDPIPYGLVFERFIDVTRHDLPDIDIDFSDAQRDKVIQYMKRKYGEKHTSQLGTIAKFGPRSALNEVGKQTRVPKWRIDKCLESLIEHSSADARANESLMESAESMPSMKQLFTEHPELTPAQYLEGLPQHTSKHASGVVICERPVHDVIPIDQRNSVAMLDKKDAEAVGMLKIDILGLTQLTILEEALELAGLHYNDIFSVPFTDKAAYDILNEGLTAGIFQLDGFACRSVLRTVKMECFDDIASVVALARPGPLQSGATSLWTRRKNGKIPVEYPHPCLEPYLRDTLGAVTFQEQILRIGREVGELTWDDITKLRQAMSKTYGAEYFSKFKSRWMPGAMRAGMDEKTAADFFDAMTAFGSWAMNKSHCVSYGIISYWCCWMKANYPLEFAVGTLNHEADSVRQIKLLRELVEMGYSYKSVDLKNAERSWTIANDGRTIVAPITAIKGIGPKHASQILAARGQQQELLPTMEKKLSKPITDIDTLYPIRDGLKRLFPEGLVSKNIHTPITPIAKVAEGIACLIVGVVVYANVRDANEPVLLAKRDGKRVEGKTQWLNLRIEDDTEIMFCKIEKDKFEKYGQPIVNKGRHGKALYALKGEMRSFNDFPIFKVSAVRYLGDLEANPVP